MKRCKKLQAGFTLVEVAMVIVIGGMVLAMASTVLLNYMKQAHALTMQERLNTIEAAMSQYLDRNGRLPCVARLTDAPDTAEYGKQIDADCVAAPPIVPGTYRVQDIPSSRWVRIGTVPVRTLNLPDQYMDDPWGDRLTYAVTEVLASPGYNDKLGAISVIDSIGNDIVPSPPGSAAHFAVVSHGENRIGAYSHEGIPGAACDPATLEGLNCSHTTTFRKTLLTGNQPGANLYDDYILFSFSYLDTSLELQMTDSIGIFDSPPAPLCPTGWFLYAGLPALPPPLIYCKKQ